MGKDKVTIYKDSRAIKKNRPWLVRWWGESDEIGTQKRYCRSFKTKVMAERFQTQKQAEINNGESRDVKTITLDKKLHK